MTRIPRREIFIRVICFHSRICVVFLKKMAFILGTKEEMTQVFTEKGGAIPVTAIKTGPLTVTQVKTKEKDGYTAVQVGFGSKKENRISKPMKGHLKGMGPFRFLREFRVTDGEWKTGGFHSPYFI